MRYLIEVKMIIASVIKHAFSVHAKLTYCSYFFFITLQLCAIFYELNVFLTRPKYMYFILISYMVTALYSNVTDACIHKIRIAYLLETAFKFIISIFVPQVSKHYAVQRLSTPQINGDVYNTFKIHLDF